LTFFELQDTMHTVGMENTFSHHCGVHFESLNVSGKKEMVTSSEQSMHWCLQRHVGF
jgi:hypothetical protein